MKKHLFTCFLAVSMIFTGLSAQPLSIISGNWVKSGAETVQLYTINDGLLNPLTSARIDAEGRFDIAFRAEKEGFYALALSPTSFQNRFVFYFKPGDALNVKIANGDYELTAASNTPENKEVAKWHAFTQPLTFKALYHNRVISNYEDFFPLFTEKLTELKKYPKANTKNKVFNAAFEDYKRNDLLFIAATFIKTPRSKHPSLADYPAYYRDINLANYTENTSLLHYPAGIALIFDAYMVKGLATPDSPIVEQMRQGVIGFLKELLTDTNGMLVKNDTLKGEVIAFGARHIKTIEKFEEYEALYGKYCITPNQKERLKTAGLSLHRNESGEKAINFAFPDQDGKVVSLAGLKGKVVYVDVWATWCGPCKAEIPHMKKLEAEYEGNTDIVFLGVSIDKNADEAKWKKFIADEQLPGIQIFAGDKANADILTPYKIAGIPRFILVGKDGNLISADAPRPSSDEIRGLLKTALSK